MAKHSGLVLPSHVTRRQFVAGAVSGAAALGLPWASRAENAVAMPPQADLRGTTFNLDIGYREVNFTGRTRTATVTNGTLPAPTLRWREGDTVTLNVTNHLAHDTSIHWHGIILPANMDGVPGISFDGIRPGETFTYRFDVRQAGTYWYHSHSGFQEQTGHYGAIVVEPREPDPIRADRDYVVLLSDWSDESPEHIYATLKKKPDYYNFNERTFGDLLRDVRQKGLSQTLADREMWNEMRMSDRDLSDVTGYTYTFLMNGRTPEQGWFGAFARGDRVRLRFINAAAMTIFDVRIPGLKMTVVAADGQDVEPVTVDEFRIGVAETYDVIVEPSADSAYTIFAQNIDRSGYARGTLSPDTSWQAEVPAMDPPVTLGHRDMGMDHAGHDMGQMDHSGHDMGQMDHSGHDMGQMDHSGHDMGQMDHSGHDMGQMDHSGHDMGQMNQSGQDIGRTPAPRPGMAGYGSALPVAHAATEYGPQVDMRADAPMDGLDDPGIGLRDHQRKYGRRVLTYADLKNRGRTLDPREPGREIALHLTGNMSRYMWSINGIKFADAEPLHLEYGERVRITLVNDTMMTHPIHLHGMWSELETGDPGRIPRKHTVIVQPGSRISYLVTADAMGGWAYHCHLLYHMPGMFRKVVVS